MESIVAEVELETVDRLGGAERIASTGRWLSYDITQTLASLSLDELRSIEDCQDSTDDLVSDQLDLDHNGPFSVYAEDNIAEAFGVETVADITPEAFQSFQERVGHERKDATTHFLVVALYPDYPEGGTYSAYHEGADEDDAVRDAKLTMLDNCGEMPEDVEDEEALQAAMETVDIVDVTPAHAVLEGAVEHCADADTVRILRDAHFSITRAASHPGVRVIAREG